LIDCVIDGAVAMMDLVLALRDPGASPAIAAARAFLWKVNFRALEKGMKIGIKSLSFIPIDCQ
jgi:hypothetical protein